MRFGGGIAFNQIYRSGAPSMGNILLMKLKLQVRVAKRMLRKTGTTLGYTQHENQGCLDQEERSIKL
jgi:hypothetical protein